jgi:glucose-6-phosphate isomerase
VTESEAWEALQRERARLAEFDMRAAFAADAERAERLRITAAGLTLDFSRNRIDDQALAALIALAQARGVVHSARAMMAGELLNNTERRAALHTLLRGSDAGTPLAEWADVHAARERMAAICDRLRSGDWKGFRDGPIRDVVTIGIGGSYLGPAFATEALRHLHAGAPRCHFVSNVDPRDLEAALAALDPAGTLFIIASKTFSTLETMENARSARRWMQDGGCPDAQLDRHFIAVSANVPRAVAFGIDAANVLPMWDWVGGRYSLWSAIGLPIAIAVGMDHFEGLLLGAHRMDVHFRNAPLAANMPVVLAMLSIWYRNFWSTASHAVIPYDQSLARLPEYLQQLVMESNGKRVDREGRPLSRPSSGVLWGAAGTNGQHSFHQLLHQGSDIVPVDFILPLASHSSNAAQHAHLVANCIAQGQALMLGRSVDEARAELTARGADANERRELPPHMAMPGNRPSNTIVMDKLTPETLGALIALYEHRTAVEGIIWNLNSFDQYGVELGKRLGKNVHRLMISDAIADESIDASTARLIAMWRARR